MEYKFIDKSVVTQELSDAVAQLFNQLNDHLKQRSLSEIFLTENPVIIACFDGKKLIGMKRYWQKADAKIISYGQ